VLLNAVLRLAGWGARSSAW